ncbi:MAG: hypothetical protein AAB881_00330 [Patescibacteria group bacterium]
MWRILLTILIGAGIAGGGAWYYADYKFEKDKSDLESQKTTLETKIKAVKNAAGNSTSTTSASSNTSASSTSATTSTCGTGKTAAAATTGFTFCYPSDWTVTTPTNKPGGVAHYAKVTTADGHSFTIYNPVPTMGAEGYNTTNEKDITSTSGLSFRRTYGAADGVINTESNWIYSAASSNISSDNVNSIIFYGFPTNIATAFAAQLDQLVGTLGLVP